MNKKLCWRYYCEFCGKGGCSGGAMARHEKRCTLNPNRECGLCALWAEDDETARGNMPEARALLPDGNDFREEEYDGLTGESCGTFRYRGLLEAVSVVFRQVRDACNNCPACILAALRQRHIPVPMIAEFNFDVESKARLSEYNESKCDEYQPDLTVSENFYGPDSYLG